MSEKDSKKAMISSLCTFLTMNSEDSQMSQKFKKPKEKPGT